MNGPEFKEKLEGGEIIYLAGANREIYLKKTSEGYVLGGKGLLAVAGAVHYWRAASEQLVSFFLPDGGPEMWTLDTQYWEADE